MNATWFASITFDSIGRAFRESFFMFWETLWALVLGFALSGAVQAFVSKSAMQRRLGRLNATSVVRAAGYGMVSSSCSYAASAMAKTLFRRGANFVVAMVFMIASTNLVIELGVVLLALIGWQFLAAQFVGGFVMIACFAVLGGMMLRGGRVDRARDRPAVGLVATQSETDAGPNSSPTFERDNSMPNSRIRTRAGWADAASYAVGDISMLRRELVIGYLVAGFLAELVPGQFWADLFVHGHGEWTNLENALIGPVIAFVSWVCSVGNVPLAAALWHGGISFAGVVTFIFADLIAAPLVLVYLRLYGVALATRLVAVLYLVMVAAGLVVGSLFSAFHLVPRTRPEVIAPTHFSWNYTTVLDICFIVVAVLIVWLHRNRVRLGGGQGYDFDLVCGMQVRVADAPASTRQGEERYVFCSHECWATFVANPDRYLDSKNLSRTDVTTSTIDPVCKMLVDPTSAEHRSVDGNDYWFCGSGCAQAFSDEPDRYRQSAPGGGSNSHRGDG